MPRSNRNFVTSYSFTWLKKLTELACMDVGNVDPFELVIRRVWDWQSCSRIHGNLQQGREL